MRFKKHALLILCISAMCSNIYANEGVSELEKLKKQMQVMQQQMQLLQKKLDEQQKQLNQQEEQSGPKSQISKDAPGVKVVAHEIVENLSISGEVVINTAHTDSDAWSDEASSDIILDTLELALDSQINPWVAGHILFLYEQEDDDTLKVDEATITIGNSNISPFYLSAGRMFVPFGNFETRMISDPITLTLAETREEALQVGVELENGLSASAYLFNGKIDRAKNAYNEVDNSHIDHFGFNLAYGMQNEQMDLNLGFGYLNNLATSDGIQDFVEDNGLCAGEACIKDYIGGISLHAVLGFKQLTFMGEYITAVDSFASGEIGPKKMQPKAWSIEAAYDFNLMGKDADIAIAYQRSDEFYLDPGSSDYFKKAWLIGMNVNIYQNTILSFEWRHAKAAAEVANMFETAGKKYADENLFQMNLSVAF